MTVDRHRENYQVLYEEDEPQAPPTSASSRTGYRLSMSAEPLSEVGVSVDAKVGGSNNRRQSATLPPPRPPPPIIVTKADVINEKEVGGAKATPEVGGAKGVAPFVPPFLRSGQLQWDKVRKFLDFEAATAVERSEDMSYDELPPQETPWLKETSLIEQLRTFLSLNP